MEQLTIEQLLNKYLEGETALEEEKKLKEFFSKADIPAEWEVYKPLFNYLDEATEDELSDTFFEDKLLPKLTQEGKVVKIPQLSYIKWVYAAAASIALFVCGYLVGKIGNNAQEDLTTIQNEIKGLKETVMLSQLKQSSPSERIKGVNYVYDMADKSPEIIDALIETLNTDDNANVRIAAANALFTFKEENKVREALIASIKVQTDPSVKIALINMLIVLKDKKAKPILEEFIQTEPLPDQVKETLKKELRKI